MRRRIVGGFLVFLVFIQLGTLLSLSSGSRVAEKEEAERKLQSNPISTRQMDVTTPITTVPTINPTTNPILNPTDSNPPLTTAASGRSWCVATQSASPAALQAALDYACGHGGADCSPIQAGGSCFNPDNIHDHASYAFNSYYQKNPDLSSCNFGATAVVTSTDPSHDACIYPSISTSSSILNTTNSNGATIFGAGPITPIGSSAAVPGGFHRISTVLCLTMLLIIRDQR